MYCLRCQLLMFFFFFFQAEDGIRDYKVTGVQTCALPICSAPRGRLLGRERRSYDVAERPHRVDLAAPAGSGGCLLESGSRGPRVPWYPAGARTGGARAAAGAGLRLAVHDLHRCGPGLRRASLQTALRRRRTADRRPDLRFVGRWGGERRVGGGARASRQLVPERARGRRRGAGGLSVRSVVIHGHFYQPPRADPWLGQVAAEPSAAPFHDWNERIEQECYRAVVAARLYAPDGRIARIVNTLASISFNFGPTLLEWLERQAPSTSAAGPQARPLSRERPGGGRHPTAPPAP